MNYKCNTDLQAEQKKNIAIATIFHPVTYNLLLWVMPVSVEHDIIQ